MGLTLKQSGDFQIAPAGTYPAIIYRVIDLGTQQINWQGQLSWSHKILLAFELHGDEKMDDGRPFVISKRYTASLSQKAKIREHLEAIRGRPFSNDELGGFHLRNVLGAPCLLQVVHESKGEAVYANIGGLMKLPKGMPKPEPINEQIYFDLDQPDMASFEKLSDKLKALIQATPEWQERVEGKGQQKEVTSDSKEFADEEIPF